MKTALSDALPNLRGRVAPGLHKVLGNMGWLFLDRILRMGMGLLVGVWMARYLGPARFGSLNFAISFVALFGTVANLGLDLIVVREIVQSTEHVHEVLGTTFALRICGAFVASVATIATISLIQPHDKEAIFLVSIISIGLFFQAADTIDLYFQSQINSKLTVWAKNSAFLAFAAIKIYLIRTQASVWEFAAATVGEIMLGAIGLLLSYRLSGGALRLWRSNFARARKLLRQSWPAIFSSMAVMIYMRIDMVMLKLIQGDAAAGLYAAVTRVSEVWYFLPAAIVSSVSPSILRAKDDTALFYGRLRALFFVMTWTSLIIGAVIALSSPLIVKGLYSAQYRAASPILAIHIWASVFVFLGVAQSPWDISENLLTLSLYRTVAGAIVNIALNLVLIPRFSAMGAAVATVVAYAISAVFANAFHPRTRVIFYLQMRSFLPARIWDYQDKLP